MIVCFKRFKDIQLLFSGLKEIFDLTNYNLLDISPASSTI